MICEIWRRRAAGDACMPQTNICLGRKVLRAFARRLKS